MLSTHIDFMDTQWIYVYIYRERESIILALTLLLYDISVQFQRNVEVGVALCVKLGATIRIH